MKLGLRSKLLLIFGCTLFVTLANYLMLRTAEQQAANHHQRLQHIEQAKSAIVELLGQLRDAETGQRGFLLTQSTNYLSPYRTGRIQARELITTLQQLTEHQPLQRERLNRIEHLLNEKFAELGQTVKLVFNGEVNQALSIVNTERGKQLMDEIRLEVKDFKLFEDHILALTQADFIASQKKLRTFFVVEGLALVLLLSLVGIYLQKHVVQPLQRLIKASDRIAEGGSPYKLHINSQDEIGQLADAFKDMHMRIRQRELMLERLRKELEVERDNAMQLATVDTLTGLLNRRRFEMVSERERLRSRREGTYLFLLNLDIDYFKKINDNYGHDHGDQVLQTIGNCLKQSCRRPTDFVFRMGGEEFVILTSSKKRLDGQQFAEILRANIEAQKLEHNYSPVSHFVTVSVGLATLAPDEDTTIKQMLQQADERLYSAKARGRNTVVWDNDSDRAEEPKNWVT